MSNVHTFEPGKAGTSDDIEVLTFELQGEIFALEATMVREILDLAPMTPVPGARRFAAAVINFRGRVIPVADLRIVFGMEDRAATIDSRIVVIEIVLGGTPTLVGLQTDRMANLMHQRMRSKIAENGIGVA